MPTESTPTGFQKHGIDVIRTTSLNMYRANPWAWALVNLGRHKVAPSMPMVRGTATEAGFNWWLNEARGMGPEARRTDAHLAAIRVHAELAHPSLTPEELGASGELVFRMLEAVIDHAEADSMWRQNNWYQQVVIDYVFPLADGGGVRVQGHLDYWNPRARTIVDLKTTARKPSRLSLSHQVQGAMYQAMMPHSKYAPIDSTEDGPPDEIGVQFLVAVGRAKDAEVVPIWFTPDDLAEGYATAMASLDSLNRFLLLGSREELLAAVMHDPESWAMRGLKEETDDGN